MRLQFQLNKINIDPVCHVQLVRHAEEFHQKNNIYGLLYGALYDDEAEVTSILSLPDGQKSTKQQLQSMEKRNDELLSNFNLDYEKIGLYLVCYARNYWDYLQTIKYYETYINTSFFLIFDFKAKQEGKNPYKAFRLKNEFALKETFKWQDLQQSSLESDNPLQQIPVQVKKNQLFELMMLWNKSKFLQDFKTQKKQSNPYIKIKENIQQYLTAFEQTEQVQHHFNENYLKQSEQATPEADKSIPFNDYCQYIGQSLKLDNYEQYFKQYLADNKHYQKLFQTESH